MVQKWKKMRNRRGKPLKKGYCGYTHKDFRYMLKGMINRVKEVASEEEEDYIGN